jgi:hypothetical protein
LEADEPPGSRRIEAVRTPNLLVCLARSPRRAAGAEEVLRGRKHDRTTQNELDGQDDDQRLYRPSRLR